MAGRFLLMKKAQTNLFAALGIFMLGCTASYLFRSDGFGLPGVQDGIRRFGFPFVIWEQGGFVYRQYFSIAAVLVDFAVAAVAGVLISVLVRRIRNRGTHSTLN